MQKATSVFPQALANFSFLVWFPPSNNCCQFRLLKWWIILTVNILRKNENTDLKLEHLFVVIIITLCPWTWRRVWDTEQFTPWAPNARSCPAPRLWARSSLQGPSSRSRSPCGGHPRNKTTLQARAEVSFQKWRGFSRSVSGWFDITRAFWVCNSSSRCADFHPAYSWACSG